MKQHRWLALCFAVCLLLALCACGAQDTSNNNTPVNASGDSSANDTDKSSDSSEQDQDSLTEYVVEGLGTFHLPEGFALESDEITEPLPSQYAIFEKDGYYIQANRMGPDAYEAAGVSLPADIEEYSTRQGVKDSVPAGTTFAYDSYGNYAAQFTQEDGQLCYYVLLQGEESFGSIFLSASEELFDAETAALWLSGSQLK